MQDRWRAPLLFVALAMVLFAPAFFAGQLFVPLHTDQLEPWRTDAPEHLAELDQRANPAVTDQLFLFDPDTRWMAEGWRQGTVPRWNPWILGGVHQSGQALIGAFYPPHLLLLWPGAPQAYAWLVALHVLLAGLGTFLWLRATGRSFAAALVAALLFAVSGPLVVRFHYYMTLYPICWVPWLLWLVHRYCERPCLRRALWVAWPVAMVVLSGFPQTGVYGVFLAGLIGAASLIRRLRWRCVLPGLGLTAAMAGGGALSLVQVLPVIDTLPRSVDRDRSAEHQVKDSGTPAMLAGYLVPDALVDPRQGWSAQWESNPLWLAFYPKVVEEEPGGRLVPQSLITRPNVTEDHCFVGALGLLLSLAAFLGRPRKRDLLVLGGLVLGWSYATGFEPVVRLARMVVPGASMGDVRRILPTLALLHAWLIAAGWERWFQDSTGRVARRTWIAALAGVLLVGGTWLTLQSGGANGLQDFVHERMLARYGDDVPAGAWPEGTFERASDLLQSRFGQATLHWGVIAGVLLGSAGLARRRRTLAACLLGLVGVGELAITHWDYNVFVPAEGFGRSHAFLEPLAFDRSQGRIHRFVPDAKADVLRDVPLPSNLGMHAGIDDAEGYIVAVPKRYAWYLQAFQSPASITPVLVHPLRTVEELTSPLLSAMAVRHVLTQEDLHQHLEAGGEDITSWLLVAQHGDNRIYRNEAALPFARTFSAAILHDIQDHEASQAVFQAILLDLATNPGAYQENVHLEVTPAQREVVARSAPRDELHPDLLVWEGPAATVTGVDREHDRLRVTLEGGEDPSLLYLAQGHDPGWRAQVDGSSTDVLPANGAFQAVLLPAGAKEVVLTFRPASVRWGLWGTLMALVAWLVLLVVSRPRPARPSAPASPDSPR